MNMLWLLFLAVPVTSITFVLDQFALTEVIQPTLEPTVEPTYEPTFEPTFHPTMRPTLRPTTTIQPSIYPSANYTNNSAEKKQLSNGIIAVSVIGSVLGAALFSVVCWYVFNMFFQTKRLPFYQV